MSKPSVLCAVDFTDACEEALRKGVEEAVRRDAILDIIHVWCPSDMVVADMSGIAGAFSDPDLPDHLKHELESLEVALPADQVRRHLMQGNSVDQIVNKANDLNSQLLVVGTHARGAIARWFLGSVVTELLRRSPCPILVCRTPPKESSQQEEAGQQTANS